MYTSSLSAVPLGHELFTSLLESTNFVLQISLPSLLPILTLRLCSHGLVQAPLSYSQLSIHTLDPLFHW